jgi:hypothetical protein
MIIRVYADHQPPHAHLYATDEKLIGKFFISHRPKNYKDIICLKDYEFDSFWKKMIFRWSQDNQRDININNWKYLIRDWNRENSDNVITDGISNEEIKKWL